MPGLNSDHKRQKAVNRLALSLPILPVVFQHNYVPNIKHVQLPSLPSLIPFDIRVSTVLVFQHGFDYRSFEDCKLSRPFSVTTGQDQLVWDTSANEG